MKNREIFEKLTRDKKITYPNREYYIEELVKRLLFALYIPDVDEIVIPDRYRIERFGIFFNDVDWSKIAVYYHKIMGKDTVILYPQKSIELAEYVKSHMKSLGWDIEVMVMMDLNV